MRSHALVAAALGIGLGGCAEATADEDGGADLADVGGHVRAASIEPIVPTLCDLLPADGVCALLCDPAALEELLPDGSCAVFECTLTTGVRALIHACNPR